MTQSEKGKIKNIGRIKKTDRTSTWVFQNELTLF
jgi:hypothetical protein